MSLTELRELYERALENYKANGRNDYDAGVCEGIKRIIEIMEAEVNK